MRSVAGAGRGGEAQSVAESFAVNPRMGVVLLLISGAAIWSMMGDDCRFLAREAGLDVEVGPGAPVQAEPPDMPTRVCAFVEPVLRQHCRGLPAEPCSASTSPGIVALPARRVELLGPGYFVRIGAHEWFTRKNNQDSEVFTVNGLAFDACPGVPNIDVRIRAQAIERIRNGSSPCSLTELEQAQAADQALRSVNGDRAERRALRKVAKLWGVSLDVLDAARHKVAAECPEGL